jgi:hypothetical protein
MLSKNWCVVLAFLAVVAFGAKVAFAAGHGTTGSHISGGPSIACRTGNGSCAGNWRQFPRVENGVPGPIWPYGGFYWGYGGIGYGWGYGLGLGYLYPGWGYALEGVPYFAQFPPVYYGYTDNMPVVKPPIPPSWAGSENSQPVSEPAAFASPPRPPLRIINPYYIETKADKP